MGVKTKKALKAALCATPFNAFPLKKTAEAAKTSKVSSHVRLYTEGKSPKWIILTVVLVVWRGNINYNNQAKNHEAMFLGIALGYNSELGQS